ncbi:MAG: hypothetical protein ACE5EX_12120, partial [Phycisphaerae bacterium]
MRFKLSAFVLLLLAGFLAAGAPSAQDNLRVGILLDGPFDRNQDVTANIMRTARAALEGTRNVTFPDASRITGDWTGSAAKAGLDRLLADDGVDVIFTLGVLGSHEAASRKNLSKPVIAPYIVQPEWLKVPSS